MNKRYPSKNVNNNSNHKRYTHQQMPSTSQQFTNEQNLPTNKKRSNNLKNTRIEIIIPIQFGERITPNFNREDVQVTSHIQSSDLRRSSTTNCAKRIEHRKSPSSSSSSSGSTQRYRPKIRRHEKLLSPKREKTPDKVAYLVDSKRELDHLRSNVEVSRSNSEHQYTTTSESRRRKRSRNRSHECEKYSCNRMRETSFGREKYGQGRGRQARGRQGRSRYLRGRQGRSRYHSL